MTASLIGENDRIELAHVIMALFDAWKVAPEQQVALLGLPASTKARSLTRYRQGTPFPDDAHLLARVENFLSINSALHTTFPHSQAMARLWITTPNRSFSNHSPLQVMLEQGMEGIRQIRRHLDCTQNWV
jgi:hypothetical protein